MNVQEDVKYDNLSLTLVFFLNYKFCNPNYYSLVISLLFLSFAVLSNISLLSRAYGEGGYIEAFQVILLVSVLIVGFVRKRYLINAYSRSTYWLRQSIFSLVIFEEISYLTTNKFNFLDYNYQSELNLHNSTFIKKSFASFNILGDDAIYLNPFLLISAFVFIFLYAGYRIPFFKRFSIISLHPYVSVGILFFLFSDGGFLKVAFLYLFRNLFSLSIDFTIVSDELIELLLYIVFMMDIVIKSFPRFSEKFLCI